MKIADATMTGELLRFHPHDPSAVITISHKLRLGQSLFLMNDEMTAYVSYDPMFGGKWIGHVHSMPEIRGKKLWKFAHETAVWMVKNRRMTQLLCFVEEYDKPLRVFVRLFNMRKVGVIGNEELYVADAKQILNFSIEKEKEVEQCQQH